MTWFTAEISKILFGREAGELLEGTQFKAQTHIQGNPIRQHKLINCKQKQESCVLPKSS